MYINGRDIVIMVKVIPNGVAETRFMNKWIEIKKDLKIMSTSFLLGLLFDSKWNKYVFDFADVEDFNKAFDWLRDFFYQMELDENFPEDEDFPEVVYVERKYDAK